jgi:hypothetical protein
VVSDPAFELFHLRPHVLHLSEVTRSALAIPLHILDAIPTLFVQTSVRLCASSATSHPCFFCRLLMSCNCSNHEPRGPSVRSRKTDCKVGSILNARIACPLVCPEVASIIYCRLAAQRGIYCGGVSVRIYLTRARARPLPFHPHFRVPF